MKLTVQKRDIVGKKVNKLREEGIIPATIYGPGREPINIQVNARDFRKTFEKAGYNKFIDITIDGEKTTVKSLVKEVNEHPIKDTLIDLSFYAVDESRKLTVDVPIELTGIAPAVKQKIGFLVQQLESITVYCYPKDVPGIFQLDLDALKTASDTITVADITVPEGVEFDSSVDTTAAIAYIATAQKEIIEDETEGEEGEEGEETEGDEGEEKENTPE